jgi:large subunit ribosomal protein L18
MRKFWFRLRRWKQKCAPSWAASRAGGNAAAAALVGKRVAEKALKAGITEVAFDRSGFRYHGRVKALAEAAREAGLKF